jgi:DNA-binding transcriptional regulator YiaG
MPTTGSVFCGSALRELRERRCMSLEELAAMLGRSVDTIRRWERGAEPPSTALPLLRAALLDTAEVDQ